MPDDPAPTPLRLTTGELRKRLDAFVDEYLKNKSPQTAGTYRRSLNTFERWYAVHKQRFRFTEDGVRAYKTYLMEERGLHQVSVSTYLTALRRFCQYLVDIGLLESNPATEVKGNRRPSTHSRQVLTEQDIDTLFATVDADTTIGKRDIAMMYLMLYAGLSEIEIVRADLEDLEQTLMGWFLRVQGKGHTAKDQQVPVDERVLEK
ncbi:MAG: site-specific integrase, partial [Bacteroidetes bacterium]|nr:site-specific integrase [Bacteroidota bacterium]